MHRLIFKIISGPEWKRAQEIGHFAGSADDLRDGYIHLSAPDQVARTAAKFFAGRTDLVLLGVDPMRLGDRLRWEASRSGTSYPHLYGVLETEAVVLVRPVALLADGTHDLPREILEC